MVIDIQNKLSQSVSVRVESQERDVESQEEFQPWYTGSFQKGLIAV